MALLINPEIIDQLGTAGSPADAGQRLALGDRIQRAGFAGVRAAGESDFDTAVGGQLCQRVGALQEWAMGVDGVCHLFVS